MNRFRYGVVAVAVLAVGGWSQHVGADEREHDAGNRSTEASEDRHWEAMGLEHEHRRRIARLNRLRELAEQQDASDRVAELAELHERLRSQHAKRLSEIRSRMDGRAARRLDEALAAGRDQEEWIRQHRERADELRDGTRQRRDAEADADGRHGRPRHDGDEAMTRERRAEHRQMHREALPEQRSDRRDDRAETHADRRETHRETRREHRRDHGHEIRGSARDRAEQRWLDARSDAGVNYRAATHMNHAASRLAEKRWREEARDRSAERWERAAERSGMFGEIRPSPDHRIPSQGEADARMGKRISPEEADREFERLWREVGGR